MYKYTRVYIIYICINYTDTHYGMVMWLLHMVIVLYMLIAHGYCIVHTYCTWLLYWLLYIVFMNTVQHAYCWADLSFSLSIHLFTLLPPSELNSSMASRTREFLSLFVQLFRTSSLSLNRLLWLLMTVCRGWLALSRLPCSLLRVLLSALPQHTAA